MNPKLIELAERRAALAARAAAQRAELAQALALWRRPLAVAEEGWAVVRFIRDHAGLLLGAAAFVMILRPKPAAGWMRQGLLVYNLATAAKRILRSFSTGSPGCR